MLVAVHILVGLLMVAGLVGSLLPFVPGTPFILAGALIYALATDFNPVGWGRLFILVMLAALAGALGYAGAALGATTSGGSRWAVAGALLGGLVGIFFGPLGLLLGPLAGAVGGELLRSGNLEGSARSGVGALAGVVAGAIAHFTLALVMVGLFLWWIWRG